MKQRTGDSLTEWCTMAYAAEQLDVSLRTVARMVGDGRLAAVVPLCGAKESKRHKVMINVRTVRVYADALQLIRGATGPKCDGDAGHPPHPVGEAPGCSLCWTPCAAGNCPDPAVHAEGGHDV